MKLFPETLEGYCKHISVKKKKIHPVLDYYSFFTCSNILQNTYKKKYYLRHKYVTLHIKWDKT